LISQTGSWTYPKQRMAIKIHEGIHLLLTFLKAKSGVHKELSGRGNSIFLIIYSLVTTQVKSIAVIKYGFMYVMCRIVFEV